MGAGAARLSLFGLAVPVMVKSYIYMAFKMLAHQTQEKYQTPTGFTETLSKG